MIQQTLFDVPVRVASRSELLRFAGWIRRPDCRGRMGWEAPGLTERERWWARSDFEDLPPANRGDRPSGENPIDRAARAKSKGDGTPPPGTHELR